MREAERKSGGNQPSDWRAGAPNFDSARFDCPQQWNEQKATKRTKKGGKVVISFRQYLLFASFVLFCELKQ